MVTVRPRSRVLLNHGGLARPVGNRAHAWAERRGALLVLDDDGAAGLGEASPLPSDDVQVYLDGASAYEAILAAVAAATHHIHLEYYIWEPDAIGMTSWSGSRQPSCSQISYASVLEPSA